MNIRQKGSAIRITLADTKKAQQIPYLLIEPNACWCSTFNAWGKQVDHPIVQFGGKTYRVVLSEVA